MAKQERSSNQNENIYPISKDKMFQLILDNIPARIFWKNRDSVYLGSNELFAQDAGIGSANKIAGKTDFDMAWKKSEADFFVKIDQKVMAAGKAELGIIEPQKHADGKESWLETNKIPLEDDDGNVIGILGTYTDISDRVEAMESLKKHTAELEFKNNELEQFAFIASHDLQEPLRTISSYIDLFESEESTNLSEREQLFFKYIKESSVRMQNLITGLLDYARIGREMKKEAVDCQELCGNLLQDLKETIDVSGAQIVIVDLPLVEASYVEMAAVFQNLLGNAIKFHKAGSTPQIRISCERKGKYWQFCVSDNGIGIDDAFNEKIFQIYQRLHSRDKYSGNGIGLTHCKKIIDIFGGNIWFDSVLNEGTKFYFTIPKV